MSIHAVNIGKTAWGSLPTVVPAECIVYDNPLALSSFCTSAISRATDTLPVPI